MPFCFFCEKPASVATHRVYVILESPYTGRLTEAFDFFTCDRHVGHTVERLHEGFSGPYSWVYSEALIPEKEPPLPSLQKDR